MKNPNGLFIRNSPRPFLIIFTLLFLVAFVLYQSQNKRQIIYAEEKEFEQESLSSLQNLLKDDVIVPIAEVLKGLPLILAQNDTRILRYIRNQKIVSEPSKLDYNLEKPSEDPSMGQGQYIRKLFNNKKNGFFVECGALDGETRSNTLYMEKELGWKGLLIEGDPKNYDLLVKKNRKAWATKSCLALKPYPHEVAFWQHFNIGKVIGNPKPNAEPSNEVVKVQCLPFFTLLAYLNVTEVDYFSLDVEGNELDVLRTIPFNSVLIKTLSVEFFHVEEGKSELSEFMTSMGYINVKTITHSNNLANDFIFVHPSMTDLIKNVKMI